LSSLSHYRKLVRQASAPKSIVVQDGGYGGFSKRVAEPAEAMKVASGFWCGAVIAPFIDLTEAEAHIADG
jgi:hypothetical protein